MFERDKDELRSLGIPIEVGHVDRCFEDEPGYRIKRDAFELPEIDLEPDEAAVVGLAARVWQHAGLAAATSDALVKLKAAGLTVDRAALDVVQPQLAADEPAFDAVWDADPARTPVRFDYRPPRAPASRPRRHLAALGRGVAAAAAGTSSATTPTAASRGCSGSPGSRARSRTDGRPGSYVVPEGTDLRALTALAGARRRRTGPRRCGSAAGAAHGLRRRAAASAEQADARRAGTCSSCVVRRDRRARRRGARRTAPTRSSLEPARAARPRRPPAREAAGVAEVGVVSGARDQVGRLLALVPYLQTRREVSLEQAARRLRRPGRSRSCKDLKVLWFCGLPGLGTGRPDRHRHGGARGGDGVIRLVQRRLPQPPAAAGQLRGVGADRGAARAARGQPPTTSRADRPGAWPSSRRAAGDGSAPTPRRSTSQLPRHTAEVARRDRLAEAIAERPAGPAGLLRADPRRDHRAGRRPAALLDADGHTYLDAWCHLAEDRRLFRLDRVTGAEVLDEPASSTPTCRPATSPRASSSRTATTCWPPSGSSPAPAGWRSTTRSRRPAELDDGGLEVALRVGDPRWLVRLMLRLAPSAQLVGPADLAEQLAPSARPAAGALRLTAPFAARSGVGTGARSSEPAIVNQRRGTP